MNKGQAKKTGETPENKTSPNGVDGETPKKKGRNFGGKDK